jgi:hypothetical protein
MSIFLYGRALSKKVDELLSENCTCIVSYIGQGTTHKIRKINKIKKIKIICNFKSNGTNPYEVEELIKYLGNEKVKQMDSFHAKVYFSESGAVICSANLSTNGLELFNEPANQLEAGIFVENNGPEYNDVLKWYKSLSEKLRKITPQKIKERQRLYNPNRGYQSKVTKLTVKEFLNNPDKFGLFFCCNGSPINEKKDTIIDIGINQTIEKYMKGHELDDWTQEDLYKPSLLHKIIDVIKDKILLDIYAEEDKNNLSRAGTLKINNTLLKYREWRTVHIKESNENTVIFFYNKFNKYKVTDIFKKTLKAMLRKSLNDKNKSKEWKKWYRSPESEGWVMTIDTLNKLI